MELSDPVTNCGCDVMAQPGNQNEIKKLRQIERLILMNLPPDKLLLLIIAVVYPVQILTAFKR